ncbi:MAG: F0F1 ATP synthase subunit epsilon [Desulfurivibrionaceae bacterium]|nr:F0F1 ATP synthase subunit epsilon [Desulfobulbales bacterium]MDT8335474.1 F0F1 ATP synthase subunit epsilon [Desulfurivibrionaceae bacterium]
MRLKVLLPTAILVDEKVDKVVAEAADGSFCLLPRHIDCVAPLVAGILSFVQAAAGAERYLAIDEGVLVKQGDEVLVSSRDGVLGEDLGELERLIAERFQTLDEQEKMSRAASAKIESGFIRKFYDMQKYG